ncbi:MAG: transcription termination/antitermination NusG family protein [Desulfatiglandales bacterium]
MRSPWGFFRLAQELLLDVREVEDMTLSIAQNPHPLFPSDLLTGFSPNGKLWWVVRTRPRDEKALAWFLFRSQIGYYLPMVKRRQPSEKGKRFSLIPLYPGYLFMVADIEGRYQAIRSNKILEVLEVKDQWRLLEELRNIQLAICSNQRLYPTKEYEPGEEVVIGRGPLKGVKGVIVRKENSTRLILRITSADLLCYVKIPEDMLDQIFN